MGRFQAVKSEVKSINVNPALSFKATPDLSLGAGVSIQWFKASLGNAVNYSAVVAAAVPPALASSLLDPTNPNTIAGLQGTAKVEGEDIGVGWNVGTMYQVSRSLRVGAQYRSSIKYHIEGAATFNPPTTSNMFASTVIAAASTPPRPFSNTDVSVDIRVPANASVGIYLQAPQDWEFLFDASWTQWSSIPEVRFVRPDGSQFNRIVYNWRDTWRFAAGANYTVSPEWKIRTGLAWDQTVIRNDADRDARLPDSDRLWLGVGTRYQPPGKWWFDLALNVVLPKDAELVNRNNGNTGAFGLLNGSYASNVVVVYAQATGTF
jgi:long-chain fatty acid transport protein